MQGSVTELIEEGSSDSLFGPRCFPGLSLVNQFCPGEALKVGRKVLIGIMVLVPRPSAPPHCGITVVWVHQIHYSETEGKRLLDKFERSDSLFFKLARDSNGAIPK